MSSAIEKAGFVDKHEERYKIPLGPWPKDKLLKEAGHLQYAHWNAALEGWAMWLLTHFGKPEPWTTSSSLLAVKRRIIMQTCGEGFQVA
ncbi:hypothetical protein N7489_003568 [Penicillium chrysogenum]|jgi:hypothetical protein|uniref:Uncharacterized protein n=1 Tax=Penicillium chrysogenum TaxID=5076 RepID=A0ABQ8W918_PENCH|nr:uncharacterized protein N7489_003568 [Penicillium chrysogenum]KAJ5253158.1 hypothetical protein N7489_003568 [Penicillium chrysogenum]KAJ5260387.1 hypothetical protein N7505_009768 [Penicillium chrysogenum]